MEKWKLDLINEVRKKHSDYPNLSPFKVTSSFCKIDSSLKIDTYTIEVCCIPDNNKTSSQTGYSTSDDAYIIKTQVCKNASTISVYVNLNSFNTCEIIIKNIEETMLKTFNKMEELKKEKENETN